MTEERLKQIIRAWRKNHPFAFAARRSRYSRHELECGVPGPANTIWDGKFIEFVLMYDEGYPLIPPVIQFATSHHHPNINKNGQFSIALFQKGWNDSMGLKEIFEAIQMFISTPCLDDRFVVNQAAFDNLLLDKKTYDKELLRCVRESQYEMGVVREM